jgi:hypothetical protein
VKLVELKGDRIGACTDSFSEPDSSNRAKKYFNWEGCEDLTSTPSEFLSIVLDIAVIARSIEGSLLKTCDSAFNPKNLPQEYVRRAKRDFKDSIIYEIHRHIVYSLPSHISPVCSPSAIQYRFHLIPM